MPGAGLIGRSVATALVVTVIVAFAISAQDEADAIGQRLMSDRGVMTAIEAARRLEPLTIADQMALCEIPAPPFAEEKRAQAYKQRFEALGLRNVRIDKAGNVLGERPGVAARPHVVVSAHLDTVFPEGTDVRVRQEGHLLKGPGIGDDCRGLGVVLGIARALDQAKLATNGSITFVGTVGEEGLGDLRGVKHLFSSELKGRVDRFVSIDGPGYGITHVAVGSYRYRVTFRGPGGHSYGAFGLPSPVHALGRALAAIADFPALQQPKTTFNVGRVGGGTSVNAIAHEAWMEVDLRSADPERLEAIDAQLRKAVHQALAAENGRWNRRALTVEIQRVGERPGGRLPTDAPILRMAVSVTKALGLPITIAEGSTDSNVPISLNVPAIAIDGGGFGTGAHSPDETFDTSDSWRGTQRATLLTIALAQ